MTEKTPGGEVRFRLPRIGDRVILNSGGPVMAIVDFYGRMVVCAWRNKYATVEQPFPIECVKLDTDSRQDGGVVK